MKTVKSLIIIVLLSVFAAAHGQIKEALLERIDFNDTTLVGSDLLKTQITEYIASAEQQGLSAQNQMYDYILATDNILQRCTDYHIYKFVYQYLIYGFSELGANMVVDYMRRLPYFEYVEATAEQMREMQDISDAFDRVKIGSKAPNIEALTVDNDALCLYNIDSKYTIVMFWSASCPHCRDQIKELGALARQYDDLSVVSICVSGELKKVKRMLKKTKLVECHNICDGKGWHSQIVDNYAVDSTPSMFLLDKNKTIIGKPFDIEEILNSIEL